MRKHISTGLGVFALALLLAGCAQTPYDKCVESTKADGMGIVENYDYCKIHEDEYN